MEDAPVRMGSARMLSFSTEWPTPRKTTGAMGWLPTTRALRVISEETTAVCCPLLGEGIVVHGKGVSQGHRWMTGSQPEPNQKNQTDENRNQNQNNPSQTHTDLLSSAGS